ncbi:MAG: four helix bundle protein [Candidatus Cloacimonetes bacterium]|nr:four helix bundle protein [Candidatus Cloacimonadota bacterium]
MYKNFTDMPVWQKAMNLSIAIFNLSSTLPRSEDYGLTSQLRRSANSVSANLSEGFGRSTKKDKCNFYIIARGSAFEVQNHLLYGKKINYFNENDVDKLINDYKELIFDLNKLMKSLKR